MIRVEILEGSGNVPRAFRVLGHAGYRESGKDIVCAAVSALTQAAAAGLKHFLGDRVAVRIAPGEMEVRLEEELPTSDLEKAGAILETMYLGLKDIEEQYGKNLQVARGAAWPASRTK